MPTPKDYMRRQRLVLYFGIALIAFGIYHVPNIWIDRSSLMQIKGTLKSGRTYVSMVFSKSFRSPKTEASSYKSELKFHLKEYDQEYYLSENIGDHYINEDHEAILKGLREADSVSVWIKKNQQHAARPQIFQIDNDETTLLNLEHLHIKNDPVTALLIVVGLFLILICSIALMLNKFRGTPFVRGNS